jgi:hypothetical protein
MASDYNYKSQMSQVFSDFIERVKEKMELFAERKKIDRSDSAPAPDISVTRSAQLRSWSGACSGVGAAHLCAPGVFQLVICNSHTYKLILEFNGRLFLPHGLKSEGK